MPYNATDFKYSFSGADARVFAWFEEYPEAVVELKSLHTISISVHEAKGQARSLGRRGVSGITRGIRTIAGSMILTVINDHPLRELMEVYTTRVDIYGDKRFRTGWSLDRTMQGRGDLLGVYNQNNILPTLLPPFNIAIQYVSELGYNKNVVSDLPSAAPIGAALMVRGIEFIDDGLVTSVNDIVSEETTSFIAYDYKPLNRFDPTEIAIQQTPRLSLTDQQEHDRLMQTLIPEDDLMSFLDEGGLSEATRRELIRQNRIEDF